MTRGSGKTALTEAQRVELNFRHNAQRRNIKLRIIEGYGGCCVCCGESQPDMLTIDHIHNDGGEHRKQMGHRGAGTSLYRVLIKEGFPRGRYQLLCFGCNWAKGRFGVCPHEQARRDLLKAVS